MPNNKGFTVFELLIGFVFLIVISYLLLSTLFSVRDRQQFTMIKNKLTDIKMSITHDIEYDLVNSGFSSLTSCGSYCYDLNFNNGSVKRLTINTFDNIISYDNTTYELAVDSYIVEPFTIEANVIDASYAGRNNSILTIIIPIEHREIEGSFGININHPYNDTL